MPRDDPGPPAPGGTGKIGASLRSRLLRSDTPSIGEVFAGRYRIERVIGSGGAGDVFEATDETLRRTVALKILRGPEFVDPPRELIERRLGLLQQWDHPNLVRTYAVGELDDVAYVVTEMLEGETLERRIRRRGPLDAREAVRLLVPVLKALEYLHGRGVVHRDVKPQNIMLTPQGVKLMDYGLARRLGVPVSEDQSDVEGTAEYLAPEQVRGANEDQRVDLYACAVVLYEMLAGSPPFVEATPVQTALAHLSRPLSFPPEVERTAPLSLLAVVAVALNREPDLRYGSATEMCDALTASLAEQVETEDARKLRRMLRRDDTRLRRERFRERVLPWLVAGALLLLGVGVWLHLARFEVARLELRDGGVLVRNVWGRELLSIAPGETVLDAEALRRDPPALIGTALAAPVGSGRGRLAAYRVDPRNRAVRLAWTREAPDDRQPAEPIRLHALSLGPDEYMVSRWAGRAGGEDGLLVVDLRGQVTGEWWWPHGPLAAVAFEPLRPGRPRGLWLGGRADALGGRPLVVRLSLPGLVPTRWAMPAGRGAVSALTVSGDDLHVTLSSGRRQVLDAAATSALRPEWLTAVAAGPDSEAFARLAAQPDLPTELARAVREALAMRPRLPAAGPDAASPGTLDPSAAGSGAGDGAGAGDAGDGAAGGTGTGSETETDAGAGTGNGSGPGASSTTPDVFL